MITKTRIAIVVSHPIQHFCPQYVSFAENKNISLKVFFGSALGFKKYNDINFKQQISWGNLALEKFDHVFLNGDSVIQADKHLDAATLEKELELYQPDLVFVYGYFQKLQRRAYHWSVKNKIPIAYVSDSELRHHRNLFKDWIKSVFLRRYFSKVSYFLSMGDANEAFYKKYGVSEEKIIRMHYPIDVVQYSHSYQVKHLLRNKIREQYAIAEEETVITVVGKLAPWKNQDHLIEAMKLLEKEECFIHLFMLGSGNMKEAWAEKAGQLTKSKVHFTGFVTIEDLPAYYAAADIYVHPASLEPHSVAISEAIYMGCPVILSDRCGSYGDTDDVQVGKNGYVYPFGNIPDLVEKLKQLIKEKETREEFGKYSHKIAFKFQNNSHHVILENLIERFDKN